MNTTPKWSALFAGDILIRDARKSIVTDELRALIAASAIKGANLEAPLPVREARAITKAGPVMSQDASATTVVRDAGFNVINLANNHTYDYGDAGLSRTLEEFSDLVIVGAGMNFADAYSAKEIVVGGIRVGLLAFCEGEFGALTYEAAARGGYAWVNHPSVNGIIAKAKRDCDVVLVQVHAGLERIKEPLPEWRARYKELIDAGADAVIASHPHVVQGMETHAGKPIFYSLGNFCFDRKDADEEWSTGIMAILDFNGREFAGVRTVPIRTTGGVVGLYKDSAYQAHLTKLSEELQSPAYMTNINAQVMRLWKTVYSRYFLDSMNTLDPRRPFMQNLKAIAKFILGRAKIDQSLLLHNMRIESHRYAIVRALTLAEDQTNISL